ncbi:MAG: DUF2807 domain-containing protein [Bacteroidia bacterium]|jgi:hypothetical protein|nr:DUF2807 domain-containing protein [Bacteroidia bacterium]
MKKAFPFILIALVAVFWIRAIDFEFGITRCDGPVIKQTRNVGAFSKINASNVFEITYRYSPTVSCELEGPENMVKATKVSVLNDALSLSLNNNFYHSDGEKITVRLTGPQFKGGELSGAVELKLLGEFPSAPIDLTLSGASEFDGSVKSDNVEFNLSGASEAKIRGKADKAVMTLCGASELYGDAFSADDLTITLSGASEARMHVAKKLNAQSSGASHFVYSGKPGSVSRNTSGASSIENE